MNKNIKALAAKKAAKDNDEFIPNARIRENRNTIRKAQQAADAGFSVSLENNRSGFTSFSGFKTPPRPSKQRRGNYSSKRQP